LRPFVKLLTAPFLVFEVDTLINPRKIKPSKAGLFFGWDQVTSLTSTNQRNQGGGPLLKVTFMGLLTALVFLPGSVFGVEIYSVQVGVFQKIKNAEDQCQALRKRIESVHLEALRIEKRGPHFAVRIGQFTQEKPARQLLSRISKAIPQAFLWKGEYNKAQWVRLYGPVPQRQKNEHPSTSGPSRSLSPSESGEPGQETLFTIPEKLLKREPSSKGRDTTREGKNGFSESSLETRRAILWGTVLESSPLAGNPLGLVPEKEITRVMVRVDKSEAAKGYPNFLQDKETEEIILFSETRQPFFRPAQKIRALVEYQGDKYKGIFWIKQAETVKP
jgi:hypothetical protein